IVMAASVFANPFETRTENENGPDWAALGVQLNTPVPGSMLAPAGAPTSENVNVCAGRSASVELAVNVYAVCPGIGALEGTPDSVGAVFTSVTVSVIAASLLATPSLARTANG